MAVLVVYWSACFPSNSDNQHSNPAEVYNFSNLLIEKNENKPKDV